MSPLRNSPRPPLRQARADQVERLIASYGGAVMLSESLYQGLSQEGLTRRIFETALDDLAEVGKLQITTNAGGRLEAALLQPETAA